MQDDALNPGDLAVITGAAQGLGRAIALRLARAGARLALWDVLDDGLSETRQECLALGVDVSIHHVDVSDEAVVASACSEVLATHGAPFALVSNAGIYPRATLLDTTPALWRRVLDVNLFGTFICGRAFAPAMLAVGRGAIVNVASGAALKGTPRGAAYAASKAAIVSLTKTMALEFAPTLRVNCLLPGLTETAQPLGDMSLDALHDKGRDLPLARAGQPEDQAGVVAFLLSGDAGYITGQSIAVNGGAAMIP
jgi:NAD(P)-dependent dehydrogenase (short-subunit alcohol dehydrogenase family)